jgi:hypothetical protein
LERFGINSLAFPFRAWVWLRLPLFEFEDDFLSPESQATLRAHCLLSVYHGESRLPQLFALHGILHLSPTLADAIGSEQLLPEGSEQELELRAVSEIQRDEIQRDDMLQARTHTPHSAVTHTYAPGQYCCLILCVCRRRCISPTRSCRGRHRALAARLGSRRRGSTITSGEAPLWLKRRGNWLTFRSTGRGPAPTSMCRRA